MEKMEGQPGFAVEIFKKPRVEAVLKQVALVSGFLWERGWAERNAGNLSVNVTGCFDAKELALFSACPRFDLSPGYPGLSQSVFLVSGTGTRMRDMAADPAGHLCFICISSQGTSFHLTGFEKDGQAVMPTSELLTHLAVQELLIRQGSTEKTVLHAHVTELIALTQLARFNSEAAINNLLWGMHPETLLFVPGGVGFVPYSLAGTGQIARLTLQSIENHKAVLWEKHGCLAVGNTLHEAFDILDILAKSARIYFLCRSAGTEPEGLTAAQLEEIRNSQLGEPGK